MSGVNYNTIEYDHIFYRLQFTPLIATRYSSYASGRRRIWRTWNEGNKGAFSIVTCAERNLPYDIYPVQTFGLPADFEPAGPSHVAELVSYLAKPETTYVTGASSSTVPSQPRETATLLFLAGQSYSINGGLQLY